MVARYYLDVVESEDGSLVDYEEARSDISWLVELIRNKKVEGSEEEYEEFDVICDRWEI